MKKIYIAGPYTGMEEEGVKLQIDAASIIIDAGHIPVAPLLSHFIHLIHPKDYKIWIKIDLAMIEICDYVYRIDMPSKGADIECLHAQACHIPVYYDLQYILDRCPIKDRSPKLLSKIDSESGK